MQVLRFASIYKEAAFSAASHANLHRWAAGIANQAFQQVMGRAPTPAERQIVMAVSDLESNYGKGWKEGQGSGSHNWGAVQTKNKENSFIHQDSSAQGKYKTNFKAYPDDIAGAADVVRNLFKANGKQRIPDRMHMQNRARLRPLAVNHGVQARLCGRLAPPGNRASFHVNFQ